jgi:hypothetical protein
MRTSNLGFNGKFHVIRPEGNDPSADLKYRAGFRGRLRVSCGRFLYFAKIELANPAAIRLGNSYQVIANSDLFARFGQMA